MKKNIVIVIIITFLSTLSTGCWNRREVNTLAVATGLAIDKDQDKYVVTVQIIIPREIASKRAGVNSPVITLTEKGETIFEALRKMTKVSSRKIYMAHLQTVVLSEEIAEEGLSKILDFLARDHEFRTDYYFIIARDAKAAEILKIVTHMENLPSLSIHESLKTSEKAWAPTKATRIIELINSLLLEGKSAVISGVKVIGPSFTSTEQLKEVEMPSEILIDNLGIFKDDKLVGWLNEDESKGYNYIIGNVKSTIGIIPIDNSRKVSLEIKHAASKIKAKFDNGKPYIDLKIEIKCSIGEVYGPIDVYKQENLNIIQNRASLKLENMCNDTVGKVKSDYQTDIFGFGEAVHRANPSYWKKVKKNWSEEFKNLPINTKIDLQIEGSGTISKSFFYKGS